MDRYFISEADQVVGVAAASQMAVGDIYRAFQKKKCWDYRTKLLWLSVLRAESSPEPAGIVWHEKKIWLYPGLADLDVRVICNKSTEVS